MDGDPTPVAHLGEFSGLPTGTSGQGAELFATEVPRPARRYPGSGTRASALEPRGPSPRDDKNLLSAKVCQFNLSGAIDPNVPLLDGF